MIKIGIVDDEINAIRVIRKYLDRMEIKHKIVFETSTFDETLTLSEEFQPDLLFLDINLLDYSGFEAAKLLQGLEIIFITAYDRDPVLAISDRSFPCLLKPIDFQEFKNTVGNTLKLICQ